MATIRLAQDSAAKLNDYANSIIQNALANDAEVGGQAVLGRQLLGSTPWLTERHGYGPTSIVN
ncbi:hypothetical protein OUHCRE1_48100 [Enterobacter asburiae]